MRRAKIVVRGVSPLLMDRMSDATLDSLATGVRIPEVKDRPAVEKAAEKIYRNDAGVIALPIEMLFGALVSAGRKVKNGRGNVSTAKATTLFDFLTVLSIDLVLTGDKRMSKSNDLFWVVDKRKGVGYQAATPTAVCIIRPKFPEWGFEVEIEYNERVINPGNVCKLFDIALSSEGLGSFRPNKRGPFGRSEVVSWVEEDLGTSDEDVVDDADLVAEEEEVPSAVY